MFFRTLLLSAALVAPAVFSQSVSLLLPERTRLLQDQRVDLVIEVRNVTAPRGFSVTANGRNITQFFSAPTTVDLDCDDRPDLVYRANLYGFQDLGQIAVSASVDTGDAGLQSDHKTVTVYPFSLQPGARKNIVLFIGDAMGTTYRDAARIVARSVENANGIPGFRGGYFDNLLEMDKMPVSGMSMTYAADRVVPDSANTAATWSTGNKVMYNALGVFPDGTDCVWRTGGRNAASVAAAIDNPRVETLWEYLKRKYGYRTGIVSTADVTDATPAGEGSHVAHRDYRAEISRQYFNSPLLGGHPVYDVILGGGLEQFEATNRADQRDLINEFKGQNYTYVTNANELRSAVASSGKLLGLFKRASNATLASSGIRASADGNMDVAYDKLGLTRPASEPTANLGGFTDQPFLDLMTQKAIETLAGPGGDQPFILMVEGASVDKQSHPNNAAGTIWDTIELDKSVGVARAFLKGRKSPDTLIVVTADHDQSMHILGTTVVSDEDLFDRSSSVSLTTSSAIGNQTVKVFKDVNTNVRAAHVYGNSGSDAPNSQGPDGPPAFTDGKIADTNGFPDYLDANGDGYPENKVVGLKGKKKLTVGFRTGNHTGSSVPVTAEGPGAILFTGYMDQGDIMFKMAHAISADLAEADAALQKLLTNSSLVKTIGK